MNAIPRRLLLKNALVFSPVLLLGWQAAGAQAKREVDAVQKGQAFFTRFSFFYEDLRHRTTNYRKGILVPVNTQVQFVKAKRNDIVVQLPNGKQLTIENVEPYSGENLDGIFSRTFSTEKTNLSGFTEAERGAILAGEVKPGMRKSAVIVALGYPPKHQTPSLESSQWRYWQNRFNTFLVQFEKDQVVAVKQ
ncbi:MAG: hypothetical protein AB9869_11610 [Verrucomicrobiia bacterium]